MITLDAAWSVQCATRLCCAPSGGYIPMARTDTKCSMPRSNYPSEISQSAHRSTHELRRHINRPAAGACQGGH